MVQAAVCGAAGGPWGGVLGAVHLAAGEGGAFRGAADRRPGDAVRRRKSAALPSVGRTSRQWRHERAARTDADALGLARMDVVCRMFVLDA